MYWVLCVFTPSVMDSVLFSRGCLRALAAFFTSAFFATCALASTRGNELTLQQIDDRSVQVEFRFTDYRFVQDTNDTIAFAGEVKGGRRGLTRDGYPAPVFMATLEIPVTGHPVVEMLDHVVRDVDYDLGGSVESPLSGWSSRPAVGVQMGLMGRRSFLKVVISPIQWRPGLGQLQVAEVIRAIIRVEDAPTTSSRAGDVAVSLSVTNNADCPPMMSGIVSPGEGEDPGSFVPRRSVGEDVAWKIRLTGPGVFRLSRSELAAAGIPTNLLDASRLKMSSRGQAVPFWGSTSGVMQANDWIKFYGAGMDSAYSTQNVYWLEAGLAPAPAYSISAPTNGAGPVATTAWARVSIGPTNEFVEAYQPLDDSFDHWFNMRLVAGSTNTFLLPTPHAVTSGVFRGGFSAYGHREYDDSGCPGSDHRTEVRIGTNLVCFTEYRGETNSVGVWTNVPASWLKGTSTMFRLIQPVPSGCSFGGIFYHAAYLERLDVCYQRLLVFSNQVSLYFEGPGGMSNVNLRVQGYGTTNVMLLDVTDPFAPCPLTGYTMVTNGGGWRLEFGQTSVAARCYALVSTGAVKSVSSIERVVFRDLSETNKTPDYLVVAPAEFRAPVYRLLKHRFKNGLSIQVATPEDIYNEFSYGVKDPAGIRQYFGYAFHHYAEPPGYALLVGRGSYDPLNFLGHSETDYIPVKMGPSSSIRNAQDQWYVTVNGADLLADLRLGRVPASNAVEFAHFVDKVISYDVSATNSDWIYTSFLAADNSPTNGPPFDFHKSSDSNILQYLSAAMGWLNFKGYIGDPSIIASNLLDNIKYGTQFISYVGHGNSRQWAQENIWNTSSASSISNDVYPVFTIFSCQNGKYQVPSTNCLAEAIVLSEHCGSACLAPTGLSSQDYADSIARGFYGAVGTGQVARLGDAVNAGLFALWDADEFTTLSEELLFYVLFGDPAQQVWGGGVP